MLYEEFLKGTESEPSESTRYAYRVINKLYMEDEIKTKTEAYKFYKRCKEDFDWIDKLEIGHGESVKKNDRLKCIISDDEAKRIINKEFCFEIDKIDICSTPYFEAYDFNFIVFIVKGYPRVYIDGKLYDIYR